MSRGGLCKNYATAVGQLLRVNASLTELNLDDNGLGAEGGKAIGDALRINTSLTSLSLSDTKLDEKGVFAIAESLPFNASLTKLDLSYPGLVSCEVEEALREAVKGREGFVLVFDDF